MAVPTAVSARLASAADAVSAARRIEQVLRRIGCEGESGFYAVACAYAGRSERALPTIVRRGEKAHRRVTKDPEGRAVLDDLLDIDPTATSVPVIYQHFVAARFRRNSGKFFTPRTVAASMAAMIRAQRGTSILDTACGGGTFLTEASAHFGKTSCVLLGNDVEPSLADLTRLRLALAPHERSFDIREENIYEPGALSDWSHGADAILANPPFSLRITLPGFTSPLFRRGYTTSDALFLDHAYEMLKPGGRLVCLLPHSIFANSDYEGLRAAVAERWVLRAAVSLPEGLFHVTADTSTRAGIVVLDRRPCTEASAVVFAHCPTVGIALNARGTGRDSDDLAELVGDRAIRTALGVA